MAKRGDSSAWHRADATSSSGQRAFKFVGGFLDLLCCGDRPLLIAPHDVYKRCLSSKLRGTGGMGKRFLGFPHQVSAFHQGYNSSLLTYKKF